MNPSSGNVSASKRVNRREKVMKRTLCLVAVLLIAGPSMAAMVSQSLNFQFSLSPNGTTLSFDQFDTAGGLYELTAVNLELLASEQANATCENDDLTLGGNMSMSLTGFVTGNGGGLSTTALMSHTTPSVSVAPSDGIAGSGPDFHDFGQLADSDTDDDMLISGIHNLSPFLGTGLIGIDIAGEGGFSFQGVSSATMIVSDFQASGIGTITYYYNIIPEPATVILLGLGSLVMSRRRK